MELSAVGYRPSAIGHRPSAIGYRPSAIGYRLSAIGYRLSAVGDGVWHWRPCMSNYLYQSWLEIVPGSAAWQAQLPPTAECRMPMAECRQPTADSRQPKADGRWPKNYFLFLNKLLTGQHWAVSLKPNRKCWKRSRTKPGKARYSPCQWLV